MEMNPRTKDRSYNPHNARLVRMQKNAEHFRDWAPDASRAERALANDCLLLLGELDRVTNYRKKLKCADKHCQMTLVIHVGNLVGNEI